jgi:hypothetical protein
MIAQRLGFYLATTSVAAQRSETKVQAFIISRENQATTRLQKRNNSPEAKHEERA